MTQTQILKRQKAVAAAIGSVRAEGLRPSRKTQKLLKDYASGKITATQLRSTTLREIKNK